MNSKKKILIVGAFPPQNSKIVGGQLTACKTLINSQLSEIFNIITVDSTQKTNPPQSFNIRLILAIFRFSKWFFMLIKHRPKAVLLFFASGASAVEKGLMVKVCNILKIPVIILPRAEALIVDYYQSKIWKKLITFLFKNTNFVICQGQKFQKFFLEEIKISEHQIQIVNNWTASSDLLALGNSREYFHTELPVEILFLAWVEETKGIFDLLNACEILQTRQTNFNLTIAGDGTALERAKSVVAEKSLTNKVNFVGWVHDQEKNELLKRHDIFVLPSWSEGFPNSLVESLAAGLACVVTDVGSISDTVKSKKNAVLVSPQSPHQLADVLENLVQNPSSRKKIASKGHALALEKFSSQKNVEKISQLLFKLIGQH